LQNAQTFLDPKVVTERVISVIQNFEKVQAIKSKVTPSARFKEDLDLDSLDAVEVVMAVEEEFGIEIPDSEADKIWSVAEAVAYVSGHPMAK
jgi:NADH dehydrogenase (ubiquinone) 1 alpha/beta subcomplex 1